MSSPRNALQTHRQLTRRKAAIWQGVAGVVIVGAIAGAAVPGVRALFAPPEPKLARGGGLVAPPATTDVTSVGDRQDAYNALKSVSMLVEVPKPVEAPKPDATVAEAPPPQPPPQVVADWVYIGSIITPTSKHALVRIEGQQQLFGVGATHGADKLVAIDPAYIEVETGGETKRIDLVERVMQTPAEGPKRPVAFRAPPVLPIPAGAGGAPGGPVMMNPMNNGARGAMPATFDQARLQAQRDAAAKAAAMNLPQPPAPDEKVADGMSKDTVGKLLGDAEMPEETRMKLFQQLGISPGMSPEQAMGRLKELGVDLGGDAGKRNIIAIERLAKEGK